MAQEETNLDERTQQLQAELDAGLGKLFYARGELPPEKVMTALHALGRACATLEPKYAFRVTMAHVDGLEDALKPSST